MDYLDEIEKLLDQAEQMEDGPAQVTVLEAAVRLADLSNDLTQGFRTRRELVGAAMTAGQVDVMLLAFSWCLSQCDRDPARFNERLILWPYRWVIDEATGFPHITRQQLEGMVEDMILRYQRNASTLRPVYLLQQSIAIDMGDRDKAVAAQKQLRKTPRDWLSDDPLTELVFHYHYLLFLRKFKDALRRVEPILNGSIRDVHFQGNVFSTVLIPLLREKRVEEAMRFHLAGYRLISRNPRYVSRVAEHLLFLTLTENFSKAKKLFEKHLPAAVNTVSYYSRFNFYRAATFFCERMAEQNTTLRLRLPSSFPKYQSEGPYHMAELHQWFLQETKAIGDAFDARNGNDRYSRKMQETREIRKLTTPFPISSSKRSGEDSADS